MELRIRELGSRTPAEPFRIAGMFKGIWRDLVRAGRSLAKARAFTFVCVVSLGIGMVTL